MTIAEAFDLTGRVALVTGGNRGLGRAFAVGLAEAGADIAIAARDDARSAAVADEIRQRGRRAVATHTDVTDPVQVHAMAESVTRELGPIDILVNNAGVAIHRSVLETSAQEWEDTWRLNVDAVWHCSREVGAAMVERRSGVIVNVGSISALIVNRPQPQAHYNASKAAVHQLTKSLAAEWAPYGIRVNAIAPGYVKTDMAPVDRPEFRRYWIEDAPMQRFATPEEIAPSVVYLASDASAFMTGSVLVIDGGYTIY